MLAFMAAVIVMTIAFIFPVALGYPAHRGGLKRRISWSFPYPSTGTTTDRSAQDRTCLAAHLIPDCRTGCAAYRTTDHRTAIHGIGIHAGGKQQGDCKRFFHVIS
jgi:hypothetical protein